MLAVPCPYFLPRAPAEWHGSYPRLPLGQAFRGECRAPGPALEPDGALLFEVCNTGYPRGRCPRFPVDAPAEAVRFHLAQGPGLPILFVTERAGWPVAHGEFQYDSLTGLLEPDPGDPILAAQARAFALTCLRRRPPSPTTHEPPAPEGR